MGPDPVSAIPRRVAFELCAEIREQYRGKWRTLAGLQCWACTLASARDPARMRVSNVPGHRGCSLVNSRYDRQPPRSNRR